MSTVSHQSISMHFYPLIQFVLDLENAENDMFLSTVHREKKVCGLDTSFFPKRMNSLELFFSVSIPFEERFFLDTLQTLMQDE